MLVAIILSSAPLAQADSCVHLWEDPMASVGIADTQVEIEYKHVKREIGETLELGDRRYVMLRMPFADLSSGERYAITFPVEIYDNGSLKHAYVPTFMSAGTPCSDVAVPGVASPVHRLPVYAYASTQIYGMNDERQLRTQFGAAVQLFFHSGSTALRIGLSAEPKGYPDCYKGKPMHPLVDDSDRCAPPLPPGDFDLVDNVDNADDTNQLAILVEHLDQLIDYVVVEKLSSLAAYAEESVAKTPAE